MIIDTHVHIFDPFRPEGAPWPDPENELLYRTTLPEQVKAQAMPEGVDGVVVVEASEWVEDNQWILDIAKLAYSRSTWSNRGPLIRTIYRC